MKVGITASCFDLLHAGHILMLKDAKSRCDHLIACLQTDPTVDRPNTKRKPVESLEERRIKLEAVRYVDEIVVYTTEQEYKDILINRKPDIRILGSDKIGQSFTGDDLDILLHFHDRSVHDYSSTNLIDRIRSSCLKKE